MRGNLGSAAKEVGRCDVAVHEGELVPAVSKGGAKSERMTRTDEMGKDGTMDKLVKVGLFDFKSDVLAARPYSHSQPSLRWILPPAPQILVPSASVQLIFLNPPGRLV